MIAVGLPRQFKCGNDNDNNIMTTIEDGLQIGRISHDNELLGNYVVSR